MTRKRNLKRLLWIALFTLIVVVSGYGLSATGNMQNPFGVFMQAQGRTEGRGPVAGSENRGQMTAPPAGRPEQGGGGEQTIAWSRVGGVLYNVWVLCAATATIVILQTVVGFLIQQVRRLPVLARANAR